MIAALLAKPCHVEFRGERVAIRRPRVADVVAALDASARGEYMPAWFVLHHVLEGDAPAFASLEEVMRLDGPAVIELARYIEPLYTEGLDLQAPPAKS